MWRSASTSRTRLPSWVRTTARLTAVEVLPSPGKQEVTTTVRRPPARESSSAVRNDAVRLGDRRPRVAVREAARWTRPPSAVADRPPCRAAAGPAGPSAPEAADRRDDAERRQADRLLDLLGRVEAAVQVREEEREADARARRPTSSPSRMFRRYDGRTAPARRQRLVDDADVRHALAAEARHHLRLGLLLEDAVEQGPLASRPRS